MQQQTPNEPARHMTPKRPKMEAGFNNVCNKIAYIETRRAKTKKFITVLQELASNGPCPIGLNHISDQTKAFKPEQALLQIMIHRQEKTTGSDTKALTDLKETLATMFPGKDKLNGGSTMLPADALSESTSPNHQPDTSRMQLINLLY